MIWQLMLKQITEELIGMKKWEYLVARVRSEVVTEVNGKSIDRRSKPLLHQFLDEKGSQRWELVATSSGKTSSVYVLMLKRELVGNAI